MERASPSCMQQYGNKVVVTVTKVVASCYTELEKISEKIRLNSREHEYVKFYIEGVGA